MPSKILSSYVIMPNLVDELDPVLVQKVGNDVMKGYTADLASMQPWIEQTMRAVDLAKLKESKKNSPWTNASNVKFPMIATAGLQFSARAYPQIIRGDKVVVAAIIGKEQIQQGPPGPDGQPTFVEVKAEKARRAETYMNYQLLVEDHRWEQDTDRQLYLESIVGTVFKKTYHEPVKDVIRSELCLPNEVIVNYKIKSLEEAQRITHEISLTCNEIIQNVRAGFFTKEASGHLTPEEEDLDSIDFLECYTYADLDEDGYKEPYIVTVKKNGGQVVRIRANFNLRDIIYNKLDAIIRIDAIQYFTAFHFMPSPDNGFYGMGFGVLLLPLNDTVNSLLNMMIDGGALASLQGGFIGSGLRLKDGEIKIKPGKWERIDVTGSVARDSIVPINYKEPSPVLFQLLGFLVEQTNKLTSITDILSGSEKTQNSPATSVTAMVEQGLKVFTGIMQRQYWSFAEEFQKIYRLNGLYLDPAKYAKILDEPFPTHVDSTGRTIIDDFDGESFDVIPVSDPNISSDVHRASRVQFLLTLLGTPLQDRLNKEEILKRVLDNANEPNYPTLMQPQAQAAPDPKMMEVQANAAQSAAQLHLDQQEEMRQNELLPLDKLLKQAQIEETKSRAMNNLAMAASAKTGDALSQLQFMVDSLIKDHQTDMDKMQKKLDATTAGLQDERERRGQDLKYKADIAKTNASSGVGGKQSNGSPPSSNA